MQNENVNIQVTLQEMEIILNVIKKTPIEGGLYPLFVKLVTQYNAIQQELVAKENTAIADLPA
jgi:hypothetical protein